MKALAYTLYNLAQTLAGGLILPWGLVHAHRRGRGALARRLGLKPPDFEPGGLWIHALSVGEVLSARPLLAVLRRRRPDIKLWLSSATATGFELALAQRQAGLIDEAFVAPLDLWPAVHRLVHKLRPSGLIIIETDLWPNALRTCRRFKAPSVVVNFRISPSRHRGHHLFKWFFKSVYAQLGGIALSGQTDLERLATLNLGPEVLIRLTGSLKYDQPAPKPPDPASYGLGPDRPVLVAGSTHQGEEEIVLEAFVRLQKNRPDLALILAPRDRPRFETAARLIKGRGLKMARFSRRERLDEEANVLLVDALGRLSSLYGLGRAAFVGGSLFYFGGHNPLEPAALGVPVLFGPYMEDFVDEAKALLGAGGGQLVRDADSLLRAVEPLLSDGRLAQKRGRAAQRVFLSHRGAAERAVELIAEVMGW